jgi:hypothetical protein
MTAVFINETAETPRIATADPQKLASHGMAARDLRILVFSSDKAPAATADPSSPKRLGPSEATGDQAQHALLFGRYLVQVQARIDRAWQRPRTEIGAARFACRATILQDPQGNVVGVRLGHCSGSERWQQSLVVAIRSASPLPAPPDPSVYADVLTLNFESDGYKLGGSEDGFESIVQSTDRARESFEHFAAGTGTNLSSAGKNQTDVIHLTIIGPHSSVPPPPITSDAQFTEDSSASQP